MRRRRLGAAIAAALGAAALWSGTRGCQPDDRGAPGATASSGANEVGGAAALPAPAAERAAGAAAEAREAELVAALRERFGATLHHKSTQIRLLDKLIAYLMKAYPEDWRDRVYAFLRRAFPELAEQIYAELPRLLTYNDWLREQRDPLALLPAAERREALWEMRRRVFGADADEIWEIALRNEQILASLDTIAASPELDLSEGFDAYLTATRTAYGASADALIRERGTELMGRFLELETVQDDLHALAPAERAEKLREVRAGLGLDDAALARWDALDAERNAAWARGEHYMQERERISAEASGAPRTQQLHALQDRLFGVEADAIRSEESADFFRFEQRRVYGTE